MGIRRTIYLPSEEVWEGLRARAADVGMTVSQYLIGEHGVDDRLGRIEGKVDLLLNLRAEGMKPAIPEKWNKKEVVEKPVIKGGEGGQDSSVIKLNAKKDEIIEDWRSQIRPMPKGGKR